jgi:hypothetical protein
MLIMDHGQGGGRQEVVGDLETVLKMLTGEK